MKTSRIAVLAAAVALLALPALTQTTGELLQKGIYTQDTAGDLDGAIAIYRQIVNSGNSPREIAAQAQYRLAQSLIEKGDLANGATEFSNLARNYADYGRLIASLAARASESVRVPGGRGGRGGGDLAGDPARLAEVQAMINKLKASGEFRGGGRGQIEPAQARVQEELKRLDSQIRIQELKAQAQMAREYAAMNFDSGSPVTIRGVVTKFQMMNPNSLITVDPMDGSGRRYTFVLAGERQIANQGLTRTAVHLGDEITVTGAVGMGGKPLSDGTFVALANTITTASGAKIFDRAQVTQ
jgi:hypothetical protein